MKKFKELIFENIDEKEYRLSNRLSYSFLSSLDEKGPKFLISEKEELDSTGVKIGSLVDNILTNEKKLNDYFVLTVDPPSGQTKILADYLIDYDEINLSDLNKLNDISLSLNLWGNKTKFETRITSFNNDNFYSYINERRNSKNKLVCSPSEWETAELIANTFYTHIFTRDIFNVSNIEIINQGMIYYNLFGYEFKSMFDKILIDHKNKIIYPYDIKTGEEINFMKQFWMFKYYLQGGLYYTGLVEKLKEYNIDYKIEPFTFLYISRKKPTLPLKYVMSVNFINKSIEGFYNSGYYHNGIKDILEAYNYYITSQNFDIKYDFVKSNGIIQIPDPEETSSI